MKLDQAHTVLKNIPHMTLQQAQVMTKFIIDNRCHNILELGFERGVSTCYMAAALDEIGEGSITTIDLESTRTLQPNIESLLDNLNLSQYVNIYYEPTSYTWRLMKFIEEKSEPLYDLCYLDGAHSWFDDGFAFFLVDKILAPGGWIILDDVDWTFARKTHKTIPQNEIKKEVIYEKEYIGLGSAILRIGRKIAKSFG